MSFGKCHSVAGSAFPLSKEYNTYVLRSWGYKKNYVFSLEDVDTMFFRTVGSL